MLRETIKKSSIYRLLKKLKIVSFLLFLIEQKNNLIRPFTLYKNIKKNEKKMALKSKEVIKILETWKKEQYNGLNQNKEKRKFPIIVSLTSYPARMNTIHLCIQSLLSQTLSPDKIILWLAEDEFKSKDLSYAHIPILENFGLSVEWIPNSIKSYAKLLPTMQKYPDSIIITVDDDKIYDPHLVSTLYQEHLAHKDCIIAHDGLYLKKEHNNKIMSFCELTQYLSKKTQKGEFQHTCETPNNNIFVQGHFGVLYPPYSLPQETFDVNTFKKLSPLADDVWLNAMAILRGTQRLILAHPLTPQSISTRKVQKHALFKTNIHQHQNDVQLAQVFEHFDLLKKI